MYRISLAVHSQTLSPGGTTRITLAAEPGTNTEAIFADNGAVRSNEVSVSSDETVATAEYNGGGIITVTGVAAGETTITVTAKLHATDFSKLADSETENLDEGADGDGAYLDESTDVTFAFGVTVSGDAPQSSGGGSGGCSAGWGALALLAAVPLVLRRKK